MRLRIVALAAALLGGAASATTYQFSGLKPGATHGEFVCRFVGRGRAKHYVVETRLRASHAGPAARILFGYQDDRNFYYAEAGDTRCTFVKVEDGIEQRIGTPSEGVLPRGSDVLLTLIRWRYHAALWVNGRQAAEAYDGRFGSGRVAVAGRSDSVTIGTIRFQVVGEMRLDDDFMRTDAEETAWQAVAGTWKLKSLRSASLSANAFMFAGLGASDDAAAMAVRGHWFWHDYVASAACRPEGDGAVGLVFYYRDPKHYHLVRWTAATVEGPRLQVIRVSGDAREVLGEAPVGFVKGQWYQLGVRVVGRTAAACVDGNALVEVTDPHLVSGSVGLYCEGTDGAVFDDVEVAEPRDFHEGFERRSRGKWLALGGTWEWQEAPLDGGTQAGRCLIGSAPEEGRYVCGQEGWQDYAVAAQVLPPVRGDVGLVAYYQDEANYYLFRLSPQKAELVRASEGEVGVLAESPCALPLGVPHGLELSVNRGVLTGRLNGKVLVRRCDRRLGHGRAGLFVRGSAGAGFDNVAVRFAERPRPLFTTHSVFEAETSMGNWAVRQSDWLTQKAELGGKAREVHWHRADYPGDVEIQAKLEKLAPSGRLWLLLAGEGGPKASGYLVSLQRLKKGCRVAVERARKTVATADLPAASPGLFSAERVGHAVLAHLDGKVALTYDDPAPLVGRSIGWAASGARLPKKGVEIFSRCVTVYAFHTAPVEWRAVGGTWEVTNRWACDPRWSFFAGERRGDPLVALWNKRNFGGDVALEFAAGIRHDPDRGGSKYAYASDINAVICGDGADLRNGYNFVFGGWNNQCSRILRNGQTLAETRDVRFPRSYSQHRQWFYIKVQKQGPRLRFFVDNKLALECTDPAPLAGRRVAIWTWKNDIMVARVRVSATGPAPCELPAGPPPQQPACCYR